MFLRVCLIIILCLPAVSSALSLGEMVVRSYLHQPLAAEIEISSENYTEVDSVKVYLASHKQFERFGLERTGWPDRLQFNIIPVAPGKAILKVTTERPINEPYIDFLLHIIWPDGAIIREYSILLDPVDYVLKADKIDNPQSVGRAEIVEPNQQTSMAPGSWPEQYGPVRAYETLSSIAQKIRPVAAGVSLAKVVQAVFNANPQAFIDANKNRLKQQAMLDIPAENVIKNTPVVTDIQESAVPAKVARQSSSRQQAALPKRKKNKLSKLFGAEGGAPTLLLDADTRDDAGTRLRIIAPAEDDKKIIDAMYSQSEKQRINQALVDASTGLSIASAIGEDIKKFRKVVDNHAVALKALHQEMDEKDARIDELIQRVSRLENRQGIDSSDNIGESTTLVDRVEDDDRAVSILDQNLKSIDQSTDTIDAAITEENETNAVADQELGAKQQDLSVADTEAESGNTWIWIVSIIVVLVLLALVWLLRRTKQSSYQSMSDHIAGFEKNETPQVKVEDIDAVDDFSEVIAGLDLNAATDEPDNQPSMESLSLEIEEAASVPPPAEDKLELSSSDNVIEKPDVAAVITQVDIYLAYRQYTPALEAIQVALEKDPDNIQFMAKRLEIFAFKKDKQAFSDYFYEVESAVMSGPEDVQERIATMLQRMSPDDDKPKATAVTSGEADIPDFIAESTEGLQTLNTEDAMDDSESDEFLLNAIQSMTENEDLDDAYKLDLQISDEDLAALQIDLMDDDSPEK